MCSASRQAARPAELLPDRGQDHGEQARGERVLGGQPTGQAGARRWVVAVPVDREQQAHCPLGADGGEVGEPVAPRTGQGTHRVALQQLRHPGRFETGSGHQM
ncbi:hypothetical protein ACFRMQ_14865 [Kitasatospora sp. NPDC056783]|uniref:hypothetical protein n=1 Tax=Kitasatospora sp. NPDC056783 TaxID=3345943 RepID=UPI003682632F